jgi:hypothetical protein
VLKSLVTCLFGLAGFLTGGVGVAVAAVVTVPCLWGIAWCMEPPAEGDGAYEPAVGARGPRSASLPLVPAAGYRPKV